jgi:phytanoyl-CoA hydroxylase
MTAVAANSRAEVYVEQGYFDVPGLLRPDEVAELCRRTTEIAEGQGAPFPEKYLELEPGANGVRSATTVRKINQCAEYDETFMKYAKLDRIVDIAEEFLGPDIKLFGSQLFMKPPGGVEKPYHQDSPYFPIAPMALVTCWIALDDVTVENGCLWVVPGTHRLGPLPHSERWLVGDREDMRVPESEFDRSREVPITLSPGSCSFHHSLILHMSHPNKTQNSRRGLAFHYMTAQSKWTNPNKPQPKYLLLRGREYPGCV